MYQEEFPTQRYPTPSRTSPLSSSIRATGYAANDLSSASQGLRAPPPAPRFHLEAGAPKGNTVSKTGFLILGLSVLLVLVALPVWDAGSMLVDFNISYWLGTGLPSWFIAVCFLSLAGFYSTTEAVIGRWRHMPRTAEVLQTMSVILTVFITLVGLVFILFAIPLQARSDKIYNDLTYECSYSTRTAHTAEVYQKLLSLRKTPDCAELFSVALCPGFVMTTEAQYLQDMEDRFQCSGFCFDESQTLSVLQWRGDTPSASFVASTAPQVNATDRRSVLGRSGPRKVGRAATLLAVGDAGSARQASGNQTANSSANRTTYTTPPTLFSQADYTFSCDSAAALALRGLALDSAYQWWYIGLSVIGGSAFVGYWSWKPGGVN